VTPAVGGLIVGCKVFQRPMNEGVKLLNTHRGNVWVGGRNHG